MLYFNRLLVSGFLALVILVVELVLYRFTHCLTLLCVANQSLYSFITIVVAAVSITLRNNNAPALRAKGTFGWGRVGVVGTLISFVVLISQYFGTTVEALQTISHLDHLDAIHEPVGICVLAFMHLLVWCVVFYQLGGYTYNQKTLLAQSKKSVKNSLGHPFNFKDICRDLAGVTLQFFTAMVIYMCRAFNVDTENLYIKYLDPLTAIAGVTIVVVLSLPIIRMAGIVVLQGCPEEFDASLIIEELRERFKSVVASIHEIHFWSLVPDHVVGTLHVKFKNQEDYLRSNSAIKDFLSSKGVSCLTLQPEFEMQGACSIGGTAEFDSAVNSETSSSCSVSCRDDVCQTKKCCIRPIAAAATTVATAPTTTSVKNSHAV